MTEKPVAVGAPGFPGGHEVPQLLVDFNVIRLATPNPVREAVLMKKVVANRRADGPQAERLIRGCCFHDLAHADRAATNHR